jgi:O-antigen/teichoic acid export membrane protein
MNTATVLLVATETVTFVLGALITFLAYRAFSRRQEPALGALVLGFGLVTLGSVVGGVLYYVGDVAPVLTLSLESVVIAAGFAVLVHSLYVGVDGTVVPAVRNAGSNADTSGRE